jgi:hypothetical protein
MRRLRTPHDARGLEVEPLDDAARADTLVAHRIEELGLPTYPVDPAEAFVAVHEDEERLPRVAFVMNPTTRDLVVKVAIPDVAALIDALPTMGLGVRAAGDARISRIAGSFEVSVAARSVRMLAVES